MKFTITITKSIKSEISSEDISNIFEKSIGVGNFDIIVDEARSSGHYITIEGGSLKKYILLSSKENKSRNAYLAQFFSTAYSDFVLDGGSKNKSFEVFLFANTTIDASYNIFIYKLLKTCDIKIINETDFLKSYITPFLSYKEIENFRNKNREKNSGNNSTYFSEETNHIELYGKVYGANGKETALICFALNKISTIPVWLYQVYESDSKELSSKDLRALEFLGVKIKEKIADKDDVISGSALKEKDLRDTPKFHYNLFKKFSFKKCYLCSCDIGPMIIGSHIHRVADIKKDENINEGEKINQIIDGDNGFWLCSNHDKLFEVGLVYFTDKSLKVSHTLNKEQIDFVSKITEKYEIEPSDFTSKTQHYINLHFNRTQRYFA